MDYVSTELPGLAEFLSVRVRQLHYHDGEANFYCGTKQLDDGAIHAVVGVQGDTLHWVAKFTDMSETEVQILLERYIAKDLVNDFATLGWSDVSSEIVKSVLLPTDMENLTIC